MSPEEMFAHVAVERSFSLTLREGEAGPELFILSNRLQEVIPLSTGQIALMAEFAVKHLAREARRAAAPQGHLD